jgi:phosphohistidine swiveling domain-containing protein
LTKRNKRKRKVWLRAKMGLLIFGMKVFIRSFYSQRGFRRSVNQVNKRAELFNQRIAQTKQLPELLTLENEIFSYIKTLMASAVKALLYPISFYFLFTSLCQKWLQNKSNEKAHTLLASGGKELQLIEAFSALWDLSRKIKTNPAQKTAGRPTLVDEFIKAESTSIVEEILHRTPGIYNQYQVFLQEHGHRCVKELDFSLPRWNEDPTFIITILKNYLKAPEYSAPRIKHKVIQQQRKLLLKQVSQKLPGWKFAVLKKLLNRAQKAQYEREYVKSEFIRLLVPLRSVFLKIGECLYTQKLLENPLDIFMLTREEVNISDRSVYLADISKRKQEYQKYEHIKLPEIITNVENLSDHASKRDSYSEDGFTGVNHVLKGIAASHGIVEGTARVISSIDEIASLKPGDILVTDHTDPGWTPVFVTIKGIITNTGGLLSHASIVAREYALPAVVNVPNATNIIKDGQTIILDGDSGIVKIISN